MIVDVDVGFYRTLADPKPRLLPEMDYTRFTRKCGERVGGDEDARCGVDVGRVVYRVCRF